MLEYFELLLAFLVSVHFESSFSEQICHQDIEGNLMAY